MPAGADGSPGAAHDEGARRASGVFAASSRSDSVRLSDGAQLAGVWAAAADVGGDVAAAAAAPHGGDGHAVVEAGANGSSGAARPDGAYCLEPGGLRPAGSGAAGPPAGERGPSPTSRVKVRPNRLASAAPHSTGQSSPIGLEGAGAAGAGGIGVLGSPAGGGTGSKQGQEWTGDEDRTVTEQLRALRGGSPSGKNMTVREAERIQAHLRHRPVNAIKCAAPRPPSARPSHMTCLLSPGVDSLRSLF